MSAKHTDGPWRIVIDGTCSGAWPFIVPADVSDEDASEEAVAELATTHVQRSRRGMPGSYSEKPQRFKPTDDHDTIMANARLIAAAPELLDALIQAQSLFQQINRDDGDEFKNLSCDGMDLLEPLIAKATGGQS